MFINGLKLGHNLVKRKKKQKQKKTRPKSISVTGVRGGDVTPKGKSSIAKPLCLSTLLECKDRMKNI